MSDTANLAAALVAAQKEMPAVDKTGTGNFGKHVTLDHLIAKTRPVLQKNGLTIIQFPATNELGAPTLRTVLIHSSGESLQADAPLFLGQRQDMQALGSAITYARRYGWSSVLGISTEPDDDGDSIRQPDAAAAKPAAPPAGSSVQAAGEGADGNHSPAPAAAPSPSDLEKLYALVREKGGDVATTMKAAETAEGRGPDVFGKWHATARKHWLEQPKPFVAPKPREEAVA